MYDIFFRVVFGINILLMGLLMGYISRITGAYFFELRNQPKGPKRDLYLHVVLLGVSTFYMLTAAVVALLYAFHHEFFNPIILVFPPGWVVMWLGMKSLYKSGHGEPNG